MVSCTRACPFEDIKENHVELALRLWKLSLSLFTCTSHYKFALSNRFAVLSLALSSAELSTNETACVGICRCRKQDAMSATSKKRLGQSSSKSARARIFKPCYHRGFDSQFLSSFFLPVFRSICLSWSFCTCGQNIGVFRWRKQIAISGRKTGKVEPERRETRTRSFRFRIIPNMK